MNHPSHDVSRLVSQARRAMRDWSGLPAESRIEVVKRFAQISETRQDELAEMISKETGKPRWESLAEAKLVPAKVALAIEAFQRRTGGDTKELPQGTGRVVYRPAGVMGVLGPFNFPAHLPNGHIVPALIAGNAVVFKPSEMTPRCGDLLCEFWDHAKLGHHILQVIHGDAETGKSLVESDVDGILFTGSYSAGTAIHRALAGRSNVMLALEMGGNNPLVIHEAKDRQAAAYLTAVSAFITAGQRCTCARRLILVEDSDSSELINRLVKITRSIKIGMPGDTNDPFYGPLISPTAATNVLEAQSMLIQAGGIPLVLSKQISGEHALISPGIIDVTGLDGLPDEEVFGPLLRVVRVRSFDEAIEEANRTTYGLSASLLSDNPDRFNQFRRQVRAGVINWNQPTIGASGRLPFGGLGASGNHRPSGFHAADYCSDATAVLETSQLSLPATMFPGIGMT